MLIKQWLLRLGLASPPSPHGLQFERRCTCRPANSIATRDCVGCNQSVPQRGDLLPKKQELPIWT